jgi:hypothetical protein
VPTVSIGFVAAKKGVKITPRKSTTEKKKP